MDEGALMILLSAFAAGLILGGFFFGGLWWTVRHGLASKQPAVWFLVSLMVRTGTVVTGFYFIGGGHWERMVAALIGFLAARIAVNRLTFVQESAVLKIGRKDAHEA